MFDMTMMLVASCITVQQPVIPIEITTCTQQRQGIEEERLAGCDLQRLSDFGLFFTFFLLLPGIHSAKFKHATRNARSGQGRDFARRMMEIMTSLKAIRICRLAAGCKMQGAGCGQHEKRKQRKPGTRDAAKGEMGGNQQDPQQASERQGTGISNRRRRVPRANETRAKQRRIIFRPALICL